MKEYYLKPNRKKIRGWKRRVTQLHKWGEAVSKPKLEGVYKRGYTFERAIIHPFYSFAKRQPPIWFYKIILSKLINAYYQWQEILDAKANAPFDLMLWIYDPSYPNSEIIRSEIYCRVVENKGDRVTDGWKIDISKQFPYSLLASPLYNLNAFDWMPTAEDNVIEQYDIDEEGWDIEELFKEGYIEKKSSNGHIYYAKQKGIRWIGRLKT